MAKKKSTKMSISLIVILIILIVGAVAGYFVAKKVTEDDKFVLVGEKVIEVEVGGSYEDEGAIVISFGKDISDKVKVDTSNVDYSTVGEYYIKYTVDNFRFKGIERYRIIKVVEAEDESV